MKPMFSDPTKLASTGGKYRGMPNLNLSEDQINDLVEYLLTLGPKPSQETIAKTEVEG